MLVWLGLIILFAAIPFLYVVFFGAPYVPTFERDLKTIFKTVELSKKSLVIDLGSGDGRLLVIAAKKGYRVIGYEINPILWLISLIRLRKYADAKVRLASMWRADVSGADLVFTFLATKYMPRLEKKLQIEMKKDSYFASYVFKLPNIEIVHKTENTHFYKF
ncbi:hypothetical protein H0W80_01570 [Candidatus Saccharibacteria bacterium]|nr:hypothetical protein [Candidatus Saccharibacteria bacterium]